MSYYIPSDVIQYNTGSCAHCSVSCISHCSRFPLWRLRRLRGSVSIIRPIIFTCQCFAEKHSCGMPATCARLTNISRWRCSLTPD
ncbi:hypothetical protein RvY_09997 [Ramazzottius varieornatus]|uniref:Uncharacterized protein n=1 Tax=Ramazzottius varieornatus TaxID=947166 RepID=A0A1D1VFS9_RAMVA|nr:hypothetical protein RvY_09997 [Ramazzottius varieornatus]